MPAASLSPHKAPGRTLSRGDHPLDSPARVRSRRTGSTGLAAWRRSHHIADPPQPQSPSRALAQGRSPTKASSMTVQSAATGRRRAPRVRSLLPPPPFQTPDPSSSVTALLASSALPKSTAPESTDSSFRAHAALLRRITLHRFDFDRYLFVYKPLAKAHAALAVQLLHVIPIAQRTASTFTPLLRSAAAYIAANAHRSVYSMVFASELKCAFKYRPVAENMLPDVVMTGEALNDQQTAALDFVQEVSSDLAFVSEDTKRRVIDGSAESDGQLERIISGVAAYMAFISRLSAVIDFELSYETVQYATTNLLGLPWKPSGGHFIIESMESGTDDPFALDSLGGSARQRLTKVNRRSGKNARGSSQMTKRHNSNVRKVSQFLTAQITAPRMTADVQRASEGWMRAALMPPPGHLFEMNDLIDNFWGFQPYYLSTSVMASEGMRRSLVLAAKELLFQEKEVSKRTKFLVCYVLARGAEKVRAKALEGMAPKDSMAHSRVRSLGSVTTGLTQPSKHAHAKQPGDYDALAIMTAHAAYLACKHGATPGELRAAADAVFVRAAVDEAAARRTDGSVGDDGVLTARDVAAAALAHGMAQRPGRIDATLVRCFEDAYGSPLKRTARGGRICHRALLEVVGAAALWGALERLAVAALALDLDMTSNMMFRAARAEPVIAEFALSPVGRDCALSLNVDEVGSSETRRARRESNVGRLSSLRAKGGGSAGSGGNRSPYSKRSTSTSGTARVVRMFSSIGSNSSH